MHLLYTIIIANYKNKLEPIWHFDCHIRDEHIKTDKEMTTFFSNMTLVKKNVRVAGLKIR